MTGLWEHSALSEDIEKELDGLKAAFSPSGGASLPSAPSSSSGSSSSTTHGQAPTVSGGEDAPPHTGSGRLEALTSTEESVSTFIKELDSILKTLGEVGDAYDDVTGRTNSLMVNCESLLEQQRTLESTAEVLRKTLQPFSEVEAAAALLGIPFDSRGLPAGSGPTPPPPPPKGDFVIDPRSPEFQDVLSRLARAMAFLDEHRELYDSTRYYRWLEQLSNRATSLVAKAMRELLEGAAKMVQEAEKKNRAAQRLAKSGSVADDTPIESHALYQKFRGLGFRMQELGALLAPPSSSSLSASSSSSGAGSRAGDSSSNSLRGRSSSHSQSQGQGGASDACAEVRESYAVIRTQLLAPVIREAALSFASAPSAAAASASASEAASASGGSDGGRGLALLSPGIRHAYSTLLRVTQLEQQLYDSLFSGLGGPASASASGESGAGAGGAAGGAGGGEGELLSVTVALCNVVGDCLRPFIIKESSVDELCRVITTLAEDIRSQIITMNVPRPLLLRLLAGLDRTVNDAQERLSYCAEVRLRADVVLFEPAPSDLQYPQCLLLAPASAQLQAAPDAAEAEAGAEAEEGAGAEAGAAALESSSSSPDSAASDDISRTWYTPLRDTLSLLSKLYGVVDMAVFEDFARRCVGACVVALRVASESLKKAQPTAAVSSGQAGLHADLFLVRHLLILREQLLPFEVRLQATERRLDFRPTLSAANKLVRDARSMLRFDVSNGLLLLAREGIPSVVENQRDAKRDLDSSLKAACHGLKLSALNALVSPLSTFVAKAEAFVGPVPVETAVSAVASTQLASEDNCATLSPDSATMLKGQAFVRPERVKELLEQTKSAAASAGAELQQALRTYIDSAVARTILMKPVQLEADLLRRKVQCVVASCVDDAAVRKELDVALRDCFSATLAALQA